MTILVTQETGRLVQEEMKNGHFASVDDLIVQGLRAWHQSSPKEGSSQASPEVRRLAVERIREMRKAVRMERRGMTLREYVHLGHRY